MRRYSLLGPHGMQRVWFDRKQLGPKGAEDVDGADEMRAQVRLIIDQEVAEGIPLNRIVVGGFSMGAAQSLHMLSDAELSQNLAGVFAMSTFLAEDSVLPSRLAAQIENGGRVPPLLYWHGTADAMIKLEWAEASVPRLQGAKVDVSWRTWPGLGHDMRSDELAALHQWLTGILE
jgi:phospholipase/carboxylesterase